MTHHDTIKSARLQQQGNGTIQISYYLMLHLREGGNGRNRFSIGKEWNKRNCRYYEAKALELAHEHYMLHKKADKETTFREVAMIAMAESACERSATTHQDYESNLERRILPVIGDKAMGSIRISDLNVLKNNIIEKGISQSRFHKVYTTLNIVFDYAYSNELIDANPMDRLKRSSKHFKQQNSRASGYYTPEEVKLILENATGMFHVLLSVLFMLGIRTGEALALSWESINWDNNTIVIAHSVKAGKLKETKTGTIRSVDMSQTLRAVLLEYRENSRSDKYLFTNMKSGKLYYDGHMISKRMFRPLLKRLGIEYKTLYATRHSFASNLIAQNAPLTYVQKALGHAKLTTTMDSYVRNEHVNNAQTKAIIDNLYA